MKNQLLIDNIAIVLAGTIPHIELLDKLKSKGYYTILVDFANNPPAKNHANLHIIESALDCKIVEKIAIKYNAKLIISVAGEGYVIACMVAEKLGLPIPFNYQTALTFSDKVLMKEKMILAGINTSKYNMFSSINELKKTVLEFPLIVKPVDSYGSKGVNITNNFADLIDKYNEASSISKNGKVIVEKFHQGTELSIYGFIENNNFRLLQTSEKFVISTKGKTVLQNVGTLTPYPLTKNIKNKIIEIGNKISSIFKINNSPLLIQGILTPNDDFIVIEIEPRLGGGLSYKVIKDRIGFDIMDAAINSYLGINNDYITKDSNEYHLIVNIFTKPGIFSHFEGVNLLMKNRIIHEFYQNRDKGFSVTSRLSSSDRVGKFVIKSFDLSDLERKFNRAIDELKVFDLEGNEVMRKDIYKNMKFSREEVI